MLSAYRNGDPARCPGIASGRAAAAAALGAKRRTPTRRAKGMRFAFAGWCKT